MALPRDEVCDGLLYELGQFGFLIRSLTTAQWNTPSRCDGWTVGDVARHTVGSMADVVAGRLDGLGSPEVTAREVAERSGRSPAELGDECDEVIKSSAGILALFDDAAWNGAGPGGYDGTLGDGVEALWFDAWMHADDIRSPLGLPSVVGPGLRGALSHIAPFIDKFGWEGTIPTADEPNAFTFALVSTGRADASLIADNPPPNIYA